jgi:predicted RNase H-like nuclease (RuvC/YqgF family)
MDSIRDTRPWFWILVAALAVVAVGALVIAISANNQSVDQKEIAEEASDHVAAKLAGLGGAIKAAEQFQEESDELAAADRQQIKRDVNAAVAGGEQELGKLKKRVVSLEEEDTAGGGEVEKLAKTTSKLEAETKKLQEGNSELTASQKGLEREVAALDKQVTRLEDRAE